MRLSLRPRRPVTGPARAGRLPDSFALPRRGRAKLRAQVERGPWVPEGYRYLPRRDATGPDGPVQTWARADGALVVLTFHRSGELIRAFVLPGAEATEANGSAIASALEAGIGTPAGIEAVLAGSPPEWVRAFERGEVDA